MTDAGIANALLIARTLGISLSELPGRETGIGIAFDVLGYILDQKEHHSARTREGMAIAKAAGKHPGRPKGSKGK